MKDINETKNSNPIDAPLYRLYFYLTEGCNLACRHCWINPKLQTQEKQYLSLSFELYRSIIKQAKPLGLTNVKFTGGEPLMNPDIEKILQYTQEQNLTVSMESNATLCTPEMAERIAASKNPFISVSLDGANAETHEWVRGIEGCFDSAIAGIKNLVDAGLKPQIIMSIMRRNVKQAEDVVRLAESLNVGSLKFNLILPAGRGKKMKDNDETVQIEELIELGHWVEDTLSKKTQLKLYYDYPPAFRKLSKMLGKDGEGCSACGILGILGVLANGTYAMCGIGTTVDELTFGNAETDSLADVWNNNETLRELRQGCPQNFQGICGSCLLKAVCLGSCIAQNYFRSKSLWAPFWFCDEAHSRGLFPETRICP